MTYLLQGMLSYLIVEAQQGRLLFYSECPSKVTMLRLLKETIEKIDNLEKELIKLRGEWRV